MGLPVTSGQDDVVLLPPLTPRNSRGFDGLTTAISVSDDAYANYAMGPLEVGFSFRVEPPTI